jgi:uncharacterized Zn finger protein (UPF0148 family)
MNRVCPRCGGWLVTEGDYKSCVACGYETCIKVPDERAGYRKLMQKHDEAEERRRQANFAAFEDKNKY